MKILFCATYPDRPIGYGRIAQVLSNALATVPDVDLYYFGFSNLPDGRVDRLIDKRIKFIDVLQQERIHHPNDNVEHFGTSIISQTIDQIQPDILFIYNDIIVTYRLLHALQTNRPSWTSYKTVSYLDVVYKFEKPTLFNYIRDKIDLTFVFTQSWKDHLVHDLKWDVEKVKTLPHGLCHDVFHPTFSDDAREEFDFDQEDFIVLNSNRNCYRKMNDLTIEGFLRFLKHHDLNPRIKLAMNCSLDSPVGYNLMECISIACTRLALPFETVIYKHIFSLGGTISDEKLNYLYNSADVGVNTCCGEGFGLCNLECASVGIPQIVTRVGGLGDIFTDDMCIFLEPKVIVTCPTVLDAHNGLLSIIDPQDLCDGLTRYFNDVDLRKRHGQTCKDELPKRYHWNDILNDMLEVLKKV